MGIRTTVEHVAPEEPSEGARQLWAFGPHHVGALASRGRKTVARALEDGIPLQLPVEAVAWALARRGYDRLADQVLESLGYAARYSLAD